MPRRLVTSLIPADPNTRDFLLEDDLSKFRRVKKHGCPERFRLFYTFSSVQRVIIPLYLNDATTLRKRGARSDPYEIFKRMVGQGHIGSDFEANWNEWVSANRELAKQHDLSVKTWTKGLTNISGKSARQSRR